MSFVRVAEKYLCSMRREKERLAKKENKGRGKNLNKKISFKKVSELAFLCADTSTSLYTTDG